MNLRTAIPILLRQTVAHVVAFTFIGYAISAGIVIFEGGMTNISTAIEFSTKFLFALLVLSVVSLPVGLFLRFLGGKVPVRPIMCTLSVGIILGLGLIPLVHPEMTDERIAIETYRAELFLIHGIAGFLGGLVWWLVEFRILRKRVA